MCGISGLLADRPHHALQAVARRMNDSLRHRGPDMADEWVDADAGIALAHRRLSILDLSPQGRQPMTSASGRYVICFNGEIYNYRALREDLIARGCRFQGSGDTEVLLAAIEQYGVIPAARACAGMFAFALWDRMERALHLVRDRVGKKPLYYGWNGKDFLFASELKAIMAVAEAGIEVDRAALTAYLRHQYVPAPHSILRGISKLPAGTHVVVTAEGASAPHPYWSIEETALAGQAEPFAAKDSVLLDRVEDALRRAVRERMIADVPVGAFLSGGIDSSLTSAIMQQEAREPISTFTIGFEEPEYDESAHAAQVAKAIGSRHHMVRMSAASFLDTVPQLPAIYDEPFADPSAIPMFHIARFARETVTVCLSGDGGDESFAGYGRYQIAGKLGRGITALPTWLRGSIAGGIDALSPAAWDRIFRYMPVSAGRALRGDMSGDRLHKLAALFRCENADALYSNLTSVHPDPETLVIGGTEPSSPLRTVLDDPLRQMMLIDSFRYLPDDILVKVDRATMAVGLEARAPLLDHRLIELAWRLPTSALLREGKGKWPLEALFRRHLPPALADRPKRGFSVPIEQWLRGPLRGWAEELLDPGLIRSQGLLDPEPVGQLWTEHLSGDRNWSFQLWTLLTFQNWLRHWQPVLSSSGASLVE
ncbi:MAG: asparagine synthase (glutamine-hydrolyzing) [Sphingobium sp.]